MRQFYTVLLILLVICGLLPFVLLSTSAYPAIDDFPCSLAARDAGLITSIVTWYKIWTARYFSVFMWWLCPLVRGWDSAYQFTATFILASHLVSTAVFLFLVRKWWPLSRKQIWLFASVFTLAYISIVPSVSECLYYYNGLICYQPASMFLLVTLGLLIRVWGSPSFWEPNSLLEFGLIGISVFCIIGSNESSMLAITLLVSGFWLYFIARNRSVSIFYSLLLLEVLLLDALVFFSPATQLRMDVSGSETRSFFFVIYEAASYSISFILKQLSNPFFYLLSFCFFAMVPENRVVVRNTLALGFLLFGVYFLSHLPSFIGEGMVQGRTANAIAYLYLLGWFFLIFYLKISLSIKNQSYKLVVGAILIAFSLALFFTHKFQNNIFDAYSDLFSGLAENHRKEVLARFHYVKSTKADSLKVLPYRYFPSSTFVADIEPNNGSTSYNAFYARYYGKKHIELRTDNPHGTWNWK